MHLNELFSVAKKLLAFGKKVEQCEGTVEQNYLLVSLQTEYSVQHIPASCLIQILYCWSDKWKPPSPAWKLKVL